MLEKIIQIIENITGFNEPDEILRADLIDDGILDSMSFITLIYTLEHEFSIEVQPTLVPSSTWRSARAIAELVEKRLKDRNNA